jgi:glucose/arabinose dehydrogenase
MAVRIVRLGSARAEGEGLRGTVRRPPRGVPKAGTARRGGRNDQGDESVKNGVVIALLVMMAAAVGAQQRPAPGTTPAQGRGGRGGGGFQLGGTPLGDGPWEYGFGANRYRVTVLTKGLDHPWGIAFVPGGDILVTERNVAQLRVIRNGKLDPTPIAGLPKDIWANPGQLGGLLDVALHPDFAQNRLIYFAYSKQHPDPAQCPDHVNNCMATLAVARARWDGGSSLSDVRDIIVTKGYAAGGPATNKGSVGPASGSFGSRLAFDKQGYLFITSGDRNIPAVSQDPQSHNGKILRLKDDGSVPADNPFVKDTKYLPEIWTLGHRNPLGLYFHPITGELWESEEGPQGGDEINIIQRGRNYGWPEVGLGRHYTGESMTKGFSAPGYEEPIVFWVPAIAISGLSIYDGDQFPAWKGAVFVGGLRNGTGQFVARVTFNAKGLPTGRDHSMLADLKQRIREVKPGPDGLLYVLTDETAGAILRVEPAVAAPPASR